MLERGVFGLAYERVMEDPRTFLVGGGLLVLLNLASSGLLLGPTLVGISRVVLKRQRGENVDFADLFYGFEDFGRNLLAGFLYGLGVAAGVLFFFLPGLVFGAVFFPVFPILAQKPMPIPDAFEAARRLTLPLLVEQTVVFSLALLLAGSGLFLFVIGVAVTLPLAVVALVLAYEELARGGQPAHV
jgi:uncharacterized membrane protein